MIIIKYNSLCAFYSYIFTSLPYLKLNYVCRYILRKVKKKSIIKPQLEPHDNCDIYVLTACDQIFKLFCRLLCYIFPSPSTLRSIFSVLIKLLIIIFVLKKK